MDILSSDRPRSPLHDDAEEFASFYTGCRKIQIAGFNRTHMNTETKKVMYHNPLYHAAGTAMMDFKPINAIHQHLCAVHVYCHDRTRQLEAHHYCQCLSPDLHQCIIYDSDQPNARLIGIEYIVSEKVFLSLSAEEKKLWHSHQHEVESGILQLQLKSYVPEMSSDLAEQPALLHLQRTYGKTIHTWAVDVDELPLGPPYLMAALTGPGQVNEELLKNRDERLGMSTEHKRELRKQYLPPYEKSSEADDWERSKKGIVFKAVEVDMKD